MIIRVITVKMTSNIESDTFQWRCRPLQSWHVIGIDASSIQWIFYSNRMNLVAHYDVRSYARHGSKNKSRSPTMEIYYFLGKGEETHNAIQVKEEEKATSIDLKRSSSNIIFIFFRTQNPMKDRCRVIVIFKANAVLICHFAGIVNQGGPFKS